MILNFECDLLGVTTEQSRQAAAEVSGCENCKGVYALLLGSGISTASGIPTGLAVTLDLIQKVAVLAGEDCEPDREAWFRTKYGSRFELASVDGRSLWWRPRTREPGEDQVPRLPSKRSFWVTTKALTTRSRSAETAGP